MKELLKISIVDKDNYFIQGLKVILRHHFTRQGVRVLFLPEKQSINANLLFQSNDISHSTLFCRDCPDGSLHQVIIIQEKTFSCCQSRDIRVCLSEKSVINRRIGLRDLLQEVDRVLAPVKAHHKKCGRCTRPLSERERQILLALGQEMRATQIAVMMNLSPKTVSTYKRNAMNKIGLTSNIALYHWLQKGGLEVERRAFL
ncbi:DNA-binding CsgD family transcriptional regulator [Rahnella inusitata]|nr:DNA-binding CsgD family transcriptional regulator [Rahnella inusitata]